MVTVTDDGPPFTILWVERNRTGGANMLVRKRGGQLRQIAVPPYAVTGPVLERLAADMIPTWPARPVDNYGR